MFDIIATIEVETIKYNYVLRSGKRDIDESRSSKEVLVFKFNSEALEQILFRTGNPVLFVDDKEMYFRYKDNKLTAIHFENDTSIWIVSSLKKFMENCKIIYSKQKMLELMSSLEFPLISSKKVAFSSKSKKELILDEFDLPSGSTIIDRQSKK